MAKKAPASQTEPLRVCIDRPRPTPVTLQRKFQAIKLNSVNFPASLNTHDQNLAKSFVENPNMVLSVTQKASIIRMALLTETKWRNGQTISVAFLDGSAKQKEKTKKYARYWTEKTMGSILKGNANIKLRFVSGKKAMIRISFIADDGSWSYLGTDCVSIPPDEPTMNFGWLRNNSSEAEWERVVIHEFGHALGCIHEHQNPGEGIVWNTDVVYEFYKGKPNEWNKEEVDSNIFEHYASDQTQFTSIDKNSIMMYSFPPEFTLNGFSSPENLHLTATDIDFIQKQYPK